MNKLEAAYEFKQMYLRNEPISESELLNNNREFFETILERWGSWHKFIKDIGLLDRHLKERSRYFTYLTMLLRVGRFNEEVLRHKNIEPEMKERIVNNFGSVRHLTKDIMEEWGPERVLYDVHTYLITGGLPSRLSNKKPMLYKHMLKEFGNEDAFYDEYQKRFWLDPRKEIIETEAEEEPEQDEDLSLLSLIVKLGYITEAEADNVRQAKDMSEIDVLAFVKKLSDEVTESELASTNQRMWLAIKQHFGTLEQARWNAEFTLAQNN